MGSAMGCFRGGDNSEDELRGGGCSFCLQWSIEPLINMYDTLFQRGPTRIAPLSERSRASVPAGPGRQDDSELDTYQSPPRPLAYDDPRCSHGQLVHRTKFSSLSSVVDDGSVGTPKGEKWYRFSTENLIDDEEKNAVQFEDNCSDDGENDENDCPICLEEYTAENPRMELQCNHDFHLSCIYEWMERSEACPVCGKVMLFYENA